MAIPHSAIYPNHWANLLWSVSTPSIVTDCDLPWLPAEHQSNLAAFFSQAKIRNRLEPQLDEFLENKPSTRLGVYFEDLWAFAFTHHPDYALLHRNLALRDRKQTLGELDFVVRHLPSGTVEHWEIAVKFYLEVENKFWVGPGLRDRLDIKLARMRDHQLTVIEQPAAAEILREKNIHIDQQWTLIPGRLFRRFADLRKPVDSGINSDSCRYCWATQSAFRQQFSHRDFRWAILPKRAWLASEGYRVLHNEPCEWFAEFINSEALRSPVCIAGILDAQERSRGFIVPDTWYQSALNCTP